MQPSFKDLDLSIPTLGNAEIRSPLRSEQIFSKDSEKILLKVRLEQEDYSNDDYTLKSLEKNSFEKTGPRRKIFFSPENTKVAIATCGGLCPGLNAVIRTIVRQLWNRYEVRNIVGVRYGYGGLGNNGKSFMKLDPTIVEDIHMRGGTLLGSSRGTPPTSEIVNNLVRNNINILFVIGGDGTMLGANEICREIALRKLSISVIGVPKTIDNDIPFVETSFGFSTAVEMASKAVLAAHEEARGHANGIGLVKLMGRNAGFIAANASLSTGCVSMCLVPEVEFKLEGENNIVDCIEYCFKTQGHAVIVVAEGAGQHYALKENGDSRKTDASGNTQFADIGVFLKQKIGTLLEKRKVSHSLKYIDPSYIVRSSPANTHDRVFCARIAQSAVHAAMAGKTAMLVGYWHGEMTHVPFKALSQRTKKINTNGAFWFTVVEATLESMFVKQIRAEKY